MLAYAARLVNLLIVTIIISDPNKAQEACIMLVKEFALYAKHINFPPVLEAAERLAISPTLADPDQLIQALSSSNY